MHRRPGRARARFLIAAAAALLLVGSVGVALRHAAGQYRLETQSQRVAVWFSSQALVELHRLRSAVLLLAEDDSQAAHDGVAERYEILLSRVALLSPENAEATEAVHRQLDSITGVLEMLEQSEADFIAYRPGDVAIRARLRAVLDTAERQLATLNLELHQERAAAVTAARENASRLAVVFAACVLGILASAGLMIALLRRGMRRAMETERTLRVLVEALPVAVTSVDVDGLLVLANGAARRLYELHGPDSQVLGRPAAQVAAAPWLAADAADVLAGRRSHRAEQREVATPEGGKRTVMTTVAPVFAGRDEVVRVVSVGLDVSEQREAVARIRWLAEHDALTGLPNRMLFAERLRAALLREPSGGLVAVHCLDLDDFKGVNDSLGHPVGDQLLVAAAARMGAVLREGDLLARLGGDEFAVIQPCIDGAAEAEQTAARLVEALSTPFRIQGFTLRSGGSVGTALAPLHGRTAEALLQRADIALYRAKAGGRGRSVLFSAEQETRLVERRRLEEDLHRALAEGQFTLVYQPKFQVSDGTMSGAEALLRWRHPERGWIPPGIFIPIAEETGLIRPLTGFVLETACRQAMAWRAAGLEVPVAVNLSAGEFRAGQGVEMVERALAATGADARLLEVELTEGIFLRNADAAAEEVAALRQRGVRVSLDDFGTGYSSLGYLQHLHFDVIKVDRQFVDRVDQPGPSRHIVDAVVRLAHGLSAKVVAEGVETQAQLRVLRELGCDVAQGFLLSRPVAPELVADLLDGHAARVAARVAESDVARTHAA